MSVSRSWTLLDDRRAVEQGLGWYYRNSEGNGNGNDTSISSRQIETWPQLIVCALFETWSLNSEGELKEQRGYSTG